MLLVVQGGFIFNVLVWEQEELQVFKERAGLERKTGLWQALVLLSTWGGGPHISAPCRNSTHQDSPQVHGLEEGLSEAVRAELLLSGIKSDPTQLYFNHLHQMLMRDFWVIQSHTHTIRKEKKVRNKERKRKEKSY